MKIAVVTGASSGIGREFVYQMAKRYKFLDEIWIIARSEDKLNKIRNSIKNVTIRPIVCDITRRVDVQRYKDLLYSKKPSVKWLVNSAGVGVIGEFTELPATELNGMCDINCTALTHITRLTIPYMAGARSYLINLASAAAFAPQPSFAVYAASKAYVLSLSTALAKELKHYGISVTAVCPGPVNTAFFEKAESLHKIKPYKKLFMADVNKVVAQALNDAEKGKHRSVYGIGMKLFFVIGRLVPDDIIVQMIG